MTKDAADFEIYLACVCLRLRGGFLFLWVLGVGYVILLWHSLSLPYNYIGNTPVPVHCFSITFTNRILGMAHPLSL